MITTAAVLTGKNKIEVMDLSIDRNLGYGEVMVSMISAGICGTQIAEIKGLKGVDKYIPHCLGHEGYGSVTDVGPGVNKVRPGDNVVLSWIKSSGIECCSVSYRHGTSKVSAGKCNTFMTTSIVSENRVVPITMVASIGSLLGCTVPTGCGSIMNIMRPKPGSNIMIVGCGAVGCAAILAAKLYTPNRIIAVDVSELKLNRARHLGATDTILLGKDDDLKYIIDGTEITGCYIGDIPYVIECSGSPDAISSAIECTSSKGMCIVCGNAPDGSRVEINPYDLINGKTIVGSWGGNSNMDNDIPMYRGLYIRGKLPVDDLISNVYPLQEVNAAIEHINSGVTCKVLLNMIPER